MNVLVTGGAGFIGINLVEELVKLGFNVKVIDNLSISNANVEHLNELGVEFYEKDIGNYDEIKDLFKGVDCVYHLAAMNRAQKSIENPLKANKVNLTGTLNVLEASRQAKVKKFVNISSSSVYKRKEDIPLKEEDELRPPHPYGVGKLAGEHYCRVYYEIYGLPVVTLRYFSIYGPGQLGNIDKAGVVAKFIYHVFNDKPIEIYGYGEQKRNFTYVGDAIKLTIKAAQSEAAVGKVFNVANETEVSINELAKIIESVTGKKPKITHTDPIIGDPKSNPANIELAKRVLGYHPSTSFEDGIKKTVEWFKKNG